MSKNYFQGNHEHPRHISVGAILLNEKGEICSHHFTKEDLKGYWPDLGINDFYILMRETLHPDETLEECLKRGLMEEFGAEGEIIDYAGTLVSRFEDEGIRVEKTTIYFTCKLISQDISRRDTKDIEGKSAIEWHKAEFLIPFMKAQAEKYGRTDIDESEILERINN